MLQDMSGEEKKGEGGGRESRIDCENSFLSTLMMLPSPIY